MPEPQRRGIPNRKETGIQIMSKRGYERPNFSRKEFRLFRVLEKPIGVSEQRWKIELRRRTLSEKGGGTFFNPDEACSISR